MRISSSRVIAYLSMCALLAACSKPSTEVEDLSNRDPAPRAFEDSGSPAPGPGLPHEDANGSAVSGTAVPVEGGVAHLSPKNTMIQFVGTHNAADPEPRTGVFMEFEGEADVDADSKTLKAINVTVKTESLVTPMDKLTNHLTSPDFLDAREHPTATFESTKITPDSVTGKLTLHGTTKEITIPASIQVSDQGLALKGTLTIDRSEFGMDKVQDKVNNEVELTVVVGQETLKP